MRLAVGLKIPDTTAITAFHTLEKLKYSALKKLERFVTYDFTLKEHDAGFEKKIVQTDILVNANKHTAFINPEKEEGFVYVLVTDRDETQEGLLSTLKHRLGFTNIANVKKGTLWKMHIADPEPENVARDIAETLLCNTHYQEYSIL